MNQLTTKKSPVMEMIEDACKVEALLDGLTCSDGKGGRVHYRDLHPRPDWWQRILDKQKRCKGE